MTFLKFARRFERVPYITYALIALNIAVFVWQTRMTHFDLILFYQTGALWHVTLHKTFLQPVRSQVLLLICSYMPVGYILSVI